MGSQRQITNTEEHVVSQVYVQQPQDLVLGYSVVQEQWANLSPLPEFRLTSLGNAILDTNGKVVSKFLLPGGFVRALSSFTLKRADRPEIRRVFASDCHVSAPSWHVRIEEGLLYGYVTWYEFVLQGLDALTLHNLLTQP